MYVIYIIRNIDQFSSVFETKFHLLLIYYKREY